jgi:Tfp pilus assembly protein FimT
LTLIELLTVVVVLGILAALAAPSLSDYLGRSGVKGVATEAFADLQFARSESVQRNAAVTVTFSASGYTITQGALTLKSVTLETPNAIASGSSMTVSFNPVRGTATVADGPVVFSNPRTAGTLRVTINQVGRASICSPSGSIKGFASC